MSELKRVGCCPCKTSMKVVGLLVAFVGVAFGLSSRLAITPLSMAMKGYTGLSFTYSKNQPGLPAKLALSDMTRMKRTFTVNRVDARMQRVARRRWHRASEPRVFIARQVQYVIACMQYYFCSLRMLKQGPRTAVFPFRHDSWHSFVLASADPHTSFTAQHLHVLDDDANTRMFARPAVSPGPAADEQFHRLSGTFFHAAAPPGGYLDLPSEVDYAGAGGTNGNDAGASQGTTDDAFDALAKQEEDEGEAHGAAAVTAIQRLLNLVWHSF